MSDEQARAGDMVDDTVDDAAIPPARMLHGYPVVRLVPAESRARRPVPDPVVAPPPILLSARVNDPGWMAHFHAVNYSITALGVRRRIRQNLKHHPVDVLRRHQWYIGTAMTRLRDWHTWLGEELTRRKRKADAASMDPAPGRRRRVARPRGTPPIVVPRKWGNHQEPGKLMEQRCVAMLRALDELDHGVLNQNKLDSWTDESIRRSQYLLEVQISRLQIWSTRYARQIAEYQEREEHVRDADAP